MKTRGKVEHGGKRFFNISHCVVIGFGGGEKAVERSGFVHGVLGFEH